MIRCRHCGGEVEEGRNFCPLCGKPLAAGEEGAAGAGESAAASAAAPPPMSSFERGRDEGDKSRRTIFIAVAVASALLVGALAYWATRPSGRTAEERLEGAVRPGSPDFPAADKLIVEFDPDQNASIGANALGNYVVTMEPTVRNFTGRTVTGLEFRASGFDLSKNVIRERTSVHSVNIEPNNVATPSIGVNFPQDNRPASLKLELTGVRFR